MYSRQRTCVALCISEVHTQHTARYNPQTPSAPSSIDTVALQENRKQDFDDGLDTRRNTAHTSIDNRIEFFSLGGSSPHYVHRIRVGHTTPEPRSNPNVVPLSESPCIAQTASRKV